MIKRTILTSGIAILCSSVGILAQAPGGAAGQTSRPQSETAKPAASAQASTTLSGCVYREQDVPGRSPNVAERAGILEDYILAEVTPQAGGASSSGAPGAVGTSGVAKSGAMYKLELVSDDKLKEMVGKRVEVTGRVDAEAGDKTTTTAPTTPTDRAIGRDRIDLPEFEVTSIKEVSGSCPAMPSAK